MSQPGSNSMGRADGSSTGDAPSMGERAAEVGSQARTAVQERADQGMEKASEGLDSAAEKLRSRADKDDGIRGDWEQKTADAMEKTAGYLRDHDSQELMHDLEEFVKTHPLQAAAGALVAGYVLAKIVR